MRAFTKVTKKDALVIETELKNLASKMKHKAYSDIEVFEKYLEQLEFKKENIAKDIQIKDLDFKQNTYVIFCYDKNPEFLDLYPITIYQK